MAWSFEPNYMSNKHVTGMGSIGGGSQGIQTATTTATFPIGHRREFEDGRVFRYGKWAADTNRGLLSASDMSVTSVAETDGSFTAASAGATQVTASDATIGSAGADDFAGGYLHITDDDGEGYTYRIKANTAGSSNSVDLDLYDGLVAAITTDTDYAITGNLYDELRGATAATDHNVSCVTTITLDVSANEYAFGQTWGVCTILSDGTTVGGGIAQLSDGVAGAVQPLAGGGSGVSDVVSEPEVGWFLFAGDTSGHVGVNLRLAP